MTVLIMQHVGGCQWRFKGHSDAAKRISDACMLHWVAQHWDSTKYWVVFNLEDGRSPDNHTLYDSKRDAVRHQPDEFKCLYIKLHPGGMNVCEAEAFLKFNRQAYLSGYRLADPDKKSGGPDLIPRIGSDTMKQQIRGLGG